MGACLKIGLVLSLLYEFVHCFQELVLLFASSICLLISWMLKNVNLECTTHGEWRIKNRIPLLTNIKKLRKTT